MIFRLLLLVVLALSGCKGKPETSTAPLKLGVLPAVGAVRTAEIYAPFVAELGKAVGRPAELVVAKDYDALRDAMITGDVHLAVVSAYLYVSTAVVRKQGNQSLHVLAQERRPADNQYVGALVVSKDNPAEKIADLKGKVIAYVDESSSSGYTYPRLRMRALGLDPDDFFSKVIFAGSHDAVVAKIKAGEADVGACSELSTTLTGLRVIERTDPIPEDAIVSLEGLDQGERKKIEAFLLAAHTNAALSNYFIARSIERYVPARIEVYAPQQEEMTRATE